MRSCESLPSDGGGGRNQDAARTAGTRRPAPRVRREARAPGTQTAGAGAGLSARLLQAQAGRPLPARFIRQYY